LPAHHQVLFDPQANRRANPFDLLQLLDLQFDLGLAYVVQQRLVVGIDLVRAEIRMRECPLGQIVDLRHPVEARPR